MHPLVEVFLRVVVLVIYYVGGGGVDRGKLVGFYPIVNWSGKILIEHWNASAGSLVDPFSFYLASGASTVDWRWSLHPYSGISPRRHVQGMAHSVRVIDVAVPGDSGLHMHVIVFAIIVIHLSVVSQPL